MSSVKYHFQEDIENILDGYKAAIDGRVCAEIDAGCCRTSADYRHRDAAIEREETVRESTIANIVMLINQALEYQSVGILSAEKKEVKA